MMDKAFIIFRYYDHRGWYPGYQTDSLTAALLALLDGQRRGEMVYLALNLSKWL